MTTPTTRRRRCCRAPRAPRRRARPHVVSVVVARRRHARRVFAPFLAPYDPDPVDLADRLRRARRRRTGSAPTRSAGTLLSRLIYGARTAWSAAARRHRLDGPRHPARPGRRAGAAAGSTRPRPRLRHHLRVPVAAAGDPGGRAVRQGAGRPGDRDEHRVHPVRRAAGALARRLRARAARTSRRTGCRGSPARWIALRRVLPNVRPIVGAQSTLNFGYVLAELAALSFLGLGVQPPTADWGAMINEGQAGLLGGHFLPAIVPAVAVVIVVVAVNIVGEELSDRIGGGIPA